MLKLLKLEGRRDPPPALPEPLLLHVRDPEPETLSEPAEEVDMADER